MTWASPLRTLRSELGLSQGQMAARLGVALESYRPWETDRRTAPSEILHRAWGHRRASAAWG